MALLQARARSRALARLADQYPNVYDRFYAEELAKEGLAPRPVRRHGTRSMYNAGCRCVGCREANAAYLREWQQRRAS